MSLGVVKIMKSGMTIRINQFSLQKSPAFLSGNDAPRNSIFYLDLLLVAGLP